LFWYLVRNPPFHDAYPSPGSRLAQILSTTSHTVYSIQRLSKAHRIASARRALTALHAWRAALPPHLGAVRPSSLVPGFRRQATALRLAYHHAVLHATRPFLLLSAQQSPPPVPNGGDDDGAEAEVAECISAASHLLSTFDGMAAAGGAVFHAFWWSSYVVFCALTVVYVWEIQPASAAASDPRQLDAAPASGRRLPGSGGGASEQTEGERARLRDLAERCRGHLERSTAANSPARRYSIILEELRAEAQAQAGLGRGILEVRVEGSGLEGSGTGAVGAQERLDGGEVQVDADFTGHHDDGSLDRIGGSLMGWQTSDWLDLDSSVSLVPIQSYKASTHSLTPGTSRLFCRTQTGISMDLLLCGFRMLVEGDSIPRSQLTRKFEFPCFITLTVGFQLAGLC